MLVYYQACLYLSITLTGIFLLRWNRFISVGFSIVYMLIPFINLGYFRIAVSESISEAAFANGLVYLCSCLMQLAYLVSVANFSKVRLPKVLTIFMFISSSVIGSIAMTTLRNGLIYRTMGLESYNGINYIVKTYGPVHNFYYILLITYLITDIVVLIKGFKKRDVSKVNATILFSLYVVNLIAFALTRAAHSMIELSPMAYVITQVIMLVMCGRLKNYAISEAALDTVIADGRTGFASFDSKRHYLGCSGRTFSYLPELKDIYIDGALPKDDERFNDLNKWLDKAEQKKGSAEFEIQRDGANYNITVTALYPKKKLTGYRLRIEDTTDERRYIALLQEARRSAETTSKAKGDFLANMSHEIRTPINAILGMDEMILRESAEEETLEYAENIRQAGNTLLGLINDVLDFSKIEAGKTDIINVDYQLSSVLNDLSNMIEARAKEKGLKFIIEVDPTLPDFLHGDEIRIKQIIMNILTNAVKYTKQGSVMLTVSQEREAGADHTDLKVRVRDTGIGIKKEDIDRLFIAFERIEEDRNRSIQGTGLGMSITQRLLKLMGSRLEVESEYSKGSTFSFTLRQGIAKDVPIGDYQTALERSVALRRQYHESFRAPDAKILVVDDTEMNIVVFRGLLKKTDIMIDSALSGDEAIRLAKKTRYDLMFLDHRMPLKDGIETLAEIRSDSSSPNALTPAVCLTANAVSGVREQYLEAGFREYLTKPIDPMKLESMIVELLPPELVKHSSSQEETTSAEETRKELLEIYLKDIDHMSGLIERLYNEEDWKDYSIKVHSLKSTSRLIGETKIAVLAEALENAGDTGDIDYIRENTQRLLSMYRAVKQKYGAAEPESTEENSAEKPTADEELISEALKEIHECADSFDYDRLCEVLDELNSYGIPEKYSRLVSGINSAAENVDWGTLKKLLAAARI